MHAFSDHAKIHAAFDPPEPLDLRTGIDRMTAWVREHGVRERVRFSEPIDVERKLPPSWKNIR